MKRLVGESISEQVCDFEQLNNNLYIPRVNKNDN